ANLDLRLEGATSGDGSLLPTAVSVDGTMAGTHLSAQLKPDRPGNLDPATAVVSVDATAEASEATSLMRQFGVPLAPEGAAIGSGQVEAKAHGSVAAGFDTALTANLGTIALSFGGKARPGLGGGHLDLKAADLAPLLRAVGLMPASGDVLPAEAATELSW